MSVSRIKKITRMTRELKNVSITDEEDYTDCTDWKPVDCISSSVESFNPWESVMQTMGEKWEKKVRGHLGKMGFVWK